MQRLDLPDDAVPGQSLHSIVGCRSTVQALVQEAVQRLIRPESTRKDKRYSDRHESRKTAIGFPGAGFGTQRREGHTLPWTLAQHLRQLSHGRCPKHSGWRQLPSETSASIRIINWAARSELPPSAKKLSVAVTATPPRI